MQHLQNKPLGVNDSLLKANTDQKKLPFGLIKKLSMSLETLKIKEFE